MICLIVFTLFARSLAENFMSGLKVVFDRERLVLGWKTFNCEYFHILWTGSFGYNPSLIQNNALTLSLLSLSGYNVDSSSKLPVNPNPSAVPTKPAMGPSSSNPEAAKGPSPNITQIDVPQPSSSSSFQWHSSGTFIAAIALLCLASLWSGWAAWALPCID